MSEADLRKEINENFQRVFKRQDDLAAENSVVHDRIEKEVTKIGVRCEPCREQVQHHEEDIRGNSQNGLKTRMHSAEVELGRVSDKQRKLGDPAKQSKRSQKVSIGAVIVAIGTALAAIITFFSSPDEPKKPDHKPQTNISTELE